MKFSDLRIGIILESEHIIKSQSERQGQLGPAFFIYFVCNIHLFSTLWKSGVQGVLIYFICQNTLRKWRGKIKQNKKGEGETI